MILADKIVTLRKKLGWSQEELAETMDVSRQSVSKWESANSIPDLNKIIKMAEIFGVTTDFLLKDENETFDIQLDSKEPETIQVSLEQATKYVDSKMAISSLITKGVTLCLCSVVPLFFFLAMAETNRSGLTATIATALGLLLLLVMIVFGVSYFIKINHYEDDITVIDSEPFELNYGVHGIFKEKLKDFRNVYNRRVSLGIFLFIFSFVPLVFTTMFFYSTASIYLMLIVLLVMIAIGLHLIIPVSTRYEAYNQILEDQTVDTAKSRRQKRAEKLAAFYWPLVLAVYLGWSLWTMNWGVTWIMLPVAGILFVSLVGLVELLHKDER